MLLGQQQLGKSVLSIRSGSPIATLTRPIINPNNLKIEGWYAHDIRQKKDVILLSQDIREVAPQGFIVNDHDSLSNSEDLVRLKPILDLKFEIMNKPVLSDDKKRLGKVNDYAFETTGYFIKKLYVIQSIVKSFNGGALMIDRDQIIEITHKKITVSRPTETETAPAGATVPA